MSVDNLPEKVSPEVVTVANCYLASSMSMTDTAKELGLETYQVAEILKDKSIRSYINGIIAETGFRQMDKIEGIMNNIIEQKLEELKEAEVGSSKDIAELLSMAHKFATDKMKIVEAREKESKVSVQRNTQVNIYDDNSNYGKLMHAIATGKEF